MCHASRCTGTRSESSEAWWATTSYLLACGAPIVPSVGVFDAIRVGPDVAPWWDMPLVTQYLHDPTAPSTRFAIATSANRLWLAPLIEPDPDVVYFRRRYNLLSRRERAALQDLATVCGFRATSDPPAWLDDRERAEMVEWFAAEPSVAAARSIAVCDRRARRRLPPDRR